MISRDLMRRTPFRLAATLALLFSLTAMVLFGVLYAALKRELASEITDRVESTLRSLSAVDHDRGFDDLVEVVSSESASIRDADTIFLLVDGDGAYRAGNVRDVAFRPGTQRIPRASLPQIAAKGEQDDVFLARWEPVSGGRLLVGSSDREIRRIDDLLSLHLGSGLAAFSALAVGVGILLAWRTQHRIRSITDVLDAVAMGQLDARIAPSRSDDDIDHIGSQINRTIARLQTLVENVNQSSSNIAHDLKKPVSLLHLKLERAMTSAKQPEDFREAIASALGDLEGIVATFEAVLRISQIEAGARRSRFCPVDLGEIVNEVAEVYQAVAEDSDRTVALANTSLEPALVTGDRELLIQMFANLVENAIRHCPPQTHIDLQLRQLDGRYVASVVDDGPGIPASERLKVFRRLYRLETARSTPGNGLGLSLVAAIADLHGATIELADNAPGLKALISFEPLPR